MPIFSRRVRVEVPAAELFEWHARPGAFERLKPPWVRLRLIQRSGGIADGGRVIFRMGVAPLACVWEARHHGFEPGRRFCDEQVRGPFARWNHTHSFDEDGAAAGILTDTVDYRLPMRALGALVAGRYMQRVLERMFAWRHVRTAHDLLRHSAMGSKRILRIAIGGASGLIGRQLSAFLTSGGHFVATLVRRAAGPENHEIAWDPEHGALEPESLEGFDAIIHLGGVGIADERWSAGRKEVIRSSRVDSTRLLAETICKLRRPPAALICASAIGYYGNRGDEVLEESSPPGNEFLSEVCVAWENAARLAEQVDVRVVRLRTGLVLSGDGGALGKMLPPFRMGLGGTVGSGRQWMSWIALDDLIGAIHWLLDHPEISGPVNAVAPGAVTNAEFTRVLGRVLGRPTFAGVPAFAIRLALGEMGERLLLAGQRVVPRVLSEGGFKFLFGDLESALRHELGAKKDH